MNTSVINNGFGNTKSLSESINDIKNSKMSRRDKIEAMIKLGLRENEVSFFLPVEHIERNPRFTFTFGVEIECVLPRFRFEAVANANGVPYHFESYNHYDNRSYFKFTTDSSIHTSNGREGEPIECVSPILDGNRSGYDKLKACCEALNAANAYVNTSTGLHVHIGARQLSHTQYINVFKNYQKMQMVINSFLAPSRRNRWYCETIENYDFSNCRTKADVQRVLTGRYYAVNAEALDDHGTIEFRQHQGSTNFTKIKNWVNFVSKLVAYSMNNVIENTISSIDEIPFLTNAEKRYFKNRKAEIERRSELEAA